MKLILISSPNKSRSEINYLIDFFENGLEIFHVKKKGFSQKKMKEYIELIPRKYHERLVLHSHFDLAVKFKLRGIHVGKKKGRRWLYWLKYYYAKIFGNKLRYSKSFHSIQSLTSEKNNFDYVLLSPIFDRHEMQDFSAAYSEKQLRSVLFRSDHNVIAFGGVQENKVALARRTGFAGVAVHSDIWKEKADRSGKFKAIVAAVEHAEHTIN